MLNFTVGPVMSYKEVLKIAGEQTPYFRTSEFSKLMLENEEFLLEYLHASRGSKCAFLTTSGTGGMEASVMGLLSSEDKVGVINGGTFGRRFVEMCRLHSINYVEIKCEFGNNVTKKQLDEMKEEGLTALLVNMNETSSGVLYDMSMISDFCRANSLFLIVDAISSFLVDPLDMEKLGANVVIMASQKALALQPGLSAVAMDEYALERVYQNRDKTMYLSLKDALDNMKRGQTPFTPAVSVLLQLNVRLRMIQEKGGVSYEIENAKELSHMFRKKIKDYPLKMLVKEEKNRSNAVTALVAGKNNATEICENLKERFDIWVCPNGGEYRNRVFRVGHIGAIDGNDYKALFGALDILNAEGII